MPWLIRAPASGEAEGRKWAARELRWFGSDENGAVRALIEALGDGVAGVRAEAAWTLAPMGPEARAAESALREALHDGDENARWAAEEALQRIAQGGGA